MKENISQLNETEARYIAQKIFEQLGGNKISTMIGMYNPSFDPDGVFSFRFKAKAKNRSNYCKIVLTGKDDYTVTFGRIHGTNYDIIEEYEGQKNAERSLLRIFLSFVFL